MRTYIFLLAGILILSSCKSKADSAQIDYSQSAKKAIELIKEKVKSEKDLEFNVEIESKHNGTYKLSTLIQKHINEIKISTVSLNASGENSENIKSYSIQQFVDSLDELIKTADTQIIIAGTYQRITVIENKKVYEFYTRKALGLIELMN